MTCDSPENRALARRFRAEMAQSRPSVLPRELIEAIATGNPNSNIRAIMPVPAVWLEFGDDQ